MLVPLQKTFELSVDQKRALFAEIQKSGRFSIIRNFRDSIISVCYKRFVKPDDALEELQKLKTAAKMHLGMTEESQKTCEFIEKIQKNIMENSSSFVPAKDSTPPDDCFSQYAQFCDWESFFASSEELKQYLEKKLTPENINTSLDKSGLTLLHKMSFLDETAFLIPLFLQKEADFWNTPLLWAIANGPFVSVKTLLETKKCDLLLADKQGKTPLFFLVAKNYSTTKSDGEPVLYSAMDLLSQMMEELEINPKYKYQVVNKPDMKGNTPLHIGCLRHDLEMVRFLLKNGARIDMLNMDLPSVVALLDAINSKGLYALPEHVGNPDVAKKIQELLVMSQ